MGKKRNTCLAAANEAKEIIEKADFMLVKQESWKGSKIAKVNCGALAHL